jgi:uncharacterized protein YndB with AHSA1/START domain
VATIRCERTLPASAQELWAIVGDAHHLPRWWPRVARVEGVDDEGFTEVMKTAKGKSVRADFRVVESTPPHARRWAQEIAGTPFERILARAETAITLEPDGGGTRVAISLAQRPRGLAVLGAFMVRSAARRQVEEALDGLAALVGATGSSSSRRRPPKKRAGR